MIGKILFWLSWPVQWCVMPLTRRVRVVIVQDHKVLVVKNWISPQEWTLPGGGVKFGESVEDAAIREVKEELGIDGKKPSQLHNGLIIAKQYGLLFRLQFVQIGINADSQIRTNWEIADTSWKSLHELNSRTLPQKVSQAVIGLGTTTSDTL